MEFNIIKLYIVTIILMALSAFSFVCKAELHETEVKSIIHVTLPQTRLISKQKVENYRPEIRLAIPDTITSASIGDSIYIYVSRQSIIYIKPDTIAEYDRLAALLDGSVSLESLNGSQITETIDSITAVLTVTPKESSNELQMILSDLKVSEDTQAALIKKYGLCTYIIDMGNNLCDILCMIDNSMKTVDAEVEVINMLMLIEKINSSEDFKDDLFLFYIKYPR